MSNIAATIQGRAKLSDPKPPYCCVCLTSTGPDIRFIDFGARIDIGAVVDPVSGGLLARLDKVEICEACVREGAEALDFNPTLHMTHLQDVRASRAEAVQYRAVARGLLDAIEAFWSNELEQCAPEELLSGIRALLRADG